MHSLTTQEIDGIRIIATGFVLLLLVWFLADYLDEGE